MNAILLATAMLALGGQDVQVSLECGTRLYIKTTPPGAEIRLDGKAIGKSDELFDVSPGSHKLSLGMDNHDAKELTVDAKKGAITRVEVTLKKHANTVISSDNVNVQGAQISGTGTLTLSSGKKDVTWMARPASTVGTLHVGAPYVDAQNVRLGSLQGWTGSTSIDTTGISEDAIWVLQASDNAGSSTFVLKPTFLFEPDDTVLTVTAPMLSTKSDKLGGAQPEVVPGALQRFNDRDYDGALNLLKEAAKKNPDLPPAQIVMAQLFSQANIAVGVQRALDQAVLDAPNDPEAYLVMGDLAFREHRLTDSRASYQKAADLLREFNGSSKRKKRLQPRILSGLVMVDEQQENWDAAQKQLEAWLKLEPKNSIAMQRLAKVLFHLKKVDEALKTLQEAVKMDPALLTPEAMIGRFYEDAGDHENAEKWMEAALKASPKDVKTQLVVGQWALETERLEKAKACADMALQIDPKSLDARILRGVVALFQKGYASAERHFEAAHLQSPDNFAATNNLALALIEQKDGAKKRKALDYSQTNLQKNPHLPEAASTYGWVLCKLGRLDEAEKAFQAAISSGGVVPDTAYYIASLSYDQGREPQAKQWLDIALKSTGPFANRQEAKALLEKLKK